MRQVKVRGTGTPVSPVILSQSKSVCHVGDSPARGPYTDI